MDHKDMECFTQPPRTGERVATQDHGMTEMSSLAPTLARLVDVALDFQGDPASVPLSELSSAEACEKPRSRIRWQCSRQL